MSRKLGEIDCCIVQLVHVPFTWWIHCLILLNLFYNYEEIGNGRVGNLIGMSLALYDFLDNTTWAEMFHWYWENWARSLVQFWSLLMCFVLSFYPFPRRGKKGKFWWIANIWGKHIINFVGFYSLSSLLISLPFSFFSQVTILAWDSISCTAIINKCLLYNHACWMIIHNSVSIVDRMKI